MTKKWDVLALGNCAIDDLLYVARFPAPDVKLRVLRSERQCGGLAATAIVAAARLGGKCAYAGALGSDEYSRFVEEAMRTQGVDVSCVVRRADAGPTHSVIIVGEEDATRNIFFEAKKFSGADENLPDEATIRSARVLFVDRWGMQGTLRAMRIARAEGTPIVGDVERSEFEFFREWMELVDHLIVPAEFAQMSTGTSTPAAAARVLWSSSRQAVVVTMGEDGCCALSDENEEVQHLDAFEVEAVDTTGCGDVFHGAYALALAEGQPLAERLRFASAAAALKATKPGGQQGIPARAQVEKLLSGHLIVAVEK